LRLKMGPLPAGSMPQKGRKIIWSDSKTFAENLLAKPELFEV